MMMSLKEMLAERNKALSDLDMDYARRMMPATTDRIRLVAMHKARYECVQISADLRAASRKFLESTRHSRLGGIPFEVIDDNH